VSQADVLQQAGPLVRARAAEKQEDSRIGGG